MINTFHSSFNPPPVPPRPGHRGPVLQKTTPLVKFLSVILLLLTLLTFGGFLYMFHRLNVIQPGYSEANYLKQLLRCKGNDLRPEEMEDCKKLAESYKTGLEQKGSMAFLTGRGHSTIPQAHLLPLQRQISVPGQLGTLIWDENHSLVKKIQLYSNGSIRIDSPGYYFVYSQVTFSKGHHETPLRQVIWTLNPKQEKPSWGKLLVSYCSLPQNSQGSDLCTASHSGIFQLEENHLLYINVTEKSLVNVDESTFGLFRLRD